MKKTICHMEQVWVAPNSSATAAAEPTGQWARDFMGDEDTLGCLGQVWQVFLCTVRIFLKCFLFFLAIGFFIWLFFLPSRYLMLNPPPGSFTFCRMCWQNSYVNRHSRLRSLNVQGCMSATCQAYRGFDKSKDLIRTYYKTW